MKNFLLLLLMIVPLISISSESVIKNFRIDGLKKTKEFYIQDLIQNFQGQEATQKNIELLTNTLKAENLFSEIIIDMEENSDTQECSVNISVKEKITFIPVPAFFISNGSFTGGAVIMDSNAFGVKTMYIAGGFFSENSFSSMMIFSKQHRNNLPGISFNFFAGKRNQTIKTYDNYNSGNYDRLYFVTGIGLSQRLLPFLELNQNFSIGWSNTECDEDFILKNSFYTNEFFGESETGLSFGTISFDSWFNCMKNISSGITFRYNSYEELSEEASLKLNYQQSIPNAEFLRIRLASSIYKGWNTDFCNKKGNGAGSVFLFADNFSTSFIAGFSGGLEAGYLKTQRGIFSVYGVYQAAFAEDYTENIIFNQGAGGGLKVYLSQIAVPAFSFDIIYNITECRFNSTVSLGMSF